MTLPATPTGRPSREEAEAAVRVLLRWACDDPTREGLLDTPARVVRSYEEYFAGYATDPVAMLERTFAEVEGYDEIVLLKDIPFQSHCEHHMAPIIGKAAIAYLPNDRVVGISKLARVLHGFARRLQVPGGASDGSRVEGMSISTIGCLDQPPCFASSWARSM